MKMLRIRLAVCLCGLIASAASADDKQSQARTSRPPKGQFKLHLKDDPYSVVMFGKKVWIGPYDPGPVARARAKQAAEDEATWQLWQADYVKDPRNPYGSHLPSPPGVQIVREVLNHFHPVPQERIAYFAALDRDPLSDSYPRKDWWVYVKTVEPRPDGWIADVMVNISFDVANQTGTGRRPTCHSFWCERYQLQGDALTYLGGHHEPALESHRVPTISVNTH